MLVATVIQKKKKIKKKVNNKKPRNAGLFNLLILEYIEAMKLEDIILFEDEDIILINKPAGLTVHPDGKAEFETLSEMILSERKDMKNVGEPIITADGDVIMRPGIVHRLDRDTTGVMVIAKTNDAYESLKEQFKDHKVKKNYRALVVGSFRSPRGVIKEQIGRSNQDIRKWAAGVHARGEKRDALTRYMVKRSGKVNDASGVAQTISYIDVFPETGRTHQIRVHMQYIQHPIIGDELYAYYVPKFSGVNRQMLHAYSITFTHPKTNKKVSYIAPLPVDLENVVNSME